MIAMPPLNAGWDFDLFETHYVFDNETSEQIVRIQVYDDDKLGIEEQFELYFPSQTRSHDVQHITLTPTSVTVIIQDDEGMDKHNRAVGEEY